MLLKIKIKQMGDRSGGREAKGGQLKNSKKNPGSTASKAKKASEDKHLAFLSQSPTPPSPTGSEPYFDSSCALLSRQYDRDRDRVINRSKTDGVRVMVIWFTDIEKQQALVDICKLNSGYIYSITGIHPDNIDRTNKKSHEGWLTKVDEIAHQPTCIGILTGLNLSREVGTHFAQESLFKSSCQLAARIGHPLILHVSADGASIMRSIELLREEGWTKDSPDYDANEKERRVIIHNILPSCGGDFDKLDACIEAGFMCSITSVGISDPDENVKQKSKEFIKKIPLSQICTATDSPWNTPQNLSDPYLRTLRNEPGNILAIIDSLSEIYIDNTRVEISLAVLENSLLIFGLNEKKEQIEKENKNNKNNYHLEDNNEDNSDDNNEIQDNIISDDNFVLNPTNINNNDSEIVYKDVNIFENIEINNLTTSINAIVIERKMENTSFYCCFKCRNRLVTPSDLITHSLNSIQSTVFKLGEEKGNCSSLLFIQYIDSIALSLNTGLKIKKAAVQCKECNFKLGKFSFEESSCPCGISVPGPTIRIFSKFVDYVDNANDTAGLVTRSLVEATELRLEESAIDSNNGILKKSKIIKPVKLVGPNRGNYTRFRDKHFGIKVKKNESPDDSSDDEN